MLLHAARQPLTQKVLLCFPAANHGPLLWLLCVLALLPLLTKGWGRGPLCVVCVAPRFNGCGPFLSCHVVRCVVLLRMCARLPFVVQPVAGFQGSVRVQPLGKWLPVDYSAGCDWQGVSPYISLIYAGHDMSVSGGRGGGLVGGVWIGLWWCGWVEDL